MKPSNKKTIESIDRVVRLSGLGADSSAAKLVSTRGGNLAPERTRVWSKYLGCEIRSAAENELLLQSHLIVERREIITAPNDEEDEDLIDALAQDLYAHEDLGTRPPSKEAIAKALLIRFKRDGAFDREFSARSCNFQLLLNYVGMHEFSRWIGPTLVDLGAAFAIIASDTGWNADVLHELRRSDIERRSNTSTVTISSVARCAGQRRIIATLKSKMPGQQLSGASVIDLWFELIKNYCEFYDIKPPTEDAYFWLAPTRDGRRIQRPTRATIDRALNGAWFRHRHALCASISQRASDRDDQQ